MIKRILRIVMMILKRTIAFAVIVGISTYVLNYLVNHVFYVENEENLRRILHIMNVLFWFLFLTCKDEEEFGEIFAVVVISMPFYLPYMFTIFEKSTTRMLISTQMHLCYLSSLSRESPIILRRKF